MASCLTVTDKIDGMKHRQNVWKSRVSKNCFDMFHKFAAIITETDSKLGTFVQRDKISEHFTILRERFEMYSRSEENPRKHNGWIIDCSLTPEHQL